MHPTFLRSLAPRLALLLCLSPAPAWAASPSLPEIPTTTALGRVRLFPEGLAPVGGEPTAAENAALAAALRDFMATGKWNSLGAFIAAQPQSPWLPSLLLNRGLRRFEEGYFSTALADWTRAWALGREAAQTTPEGAALVARALAEAVKMNCRVGRVADAKALLAEFGDRPAFGLNATLLDEARKAIGQMESLPADCFKCGPYALSSILQYQRAHTPQTYACLTTFPTTAQGTSLAQVAELANGSLGMKMQPARRLSPNSPPPLPAVVHWKLEHYGALLEYKDGRYLLQDPTFGTSQWILAEALAEDASGFFLVPAGKLPVGYTAVAAADAGQIWGRGNCAVGDGSGTGPKAPRKPKCPKGKGRGMADWSIHTSLASLNIEDIPLGYQPPAGPEVAFRVNYSQLEQNQPTTINYSNVGPLWNFNWVSSLTFDSNNAFARMGEGGSELFTRFNAGTGTYDPEQGSGALLVRVSPTLYERRDSDGSKLVFGLPDGSGRIFLTQQVDAQGNALTFAYDANFRLVTVTDAIGQVTTIEHGSNTPGQPLFYRVTKVTDPFGRFTTLTYDASQRLTSVTDTIGIVSQFTYDASNRVTSLITPYGTTSFEFGSSNAAPAGVVAFVEVTEPNGAKQRVESVQTSVIPTTETVVPVGMPATNLYMQWRNSFYWDRKAMADAPGDYTKAEISHFLHLNMSAIKANVLESTKSPLENRVWYAYQGQNDSIFSSEGMSSQPSHIGRVLDDGSTQLYRYTYNAQGNVTQAIDPLGRTTKYAYAADGIDLLTIKQVNAQGGDDLLATYTWNAQHRPVTFTDANGATTTYTYNARGQNTTSTNARGEVVTYLYSAQGYLNSIDGPLPGAQDTITVGYDAVGRPRTVTTGEGYTLTADYDQLDRPTRLTYPDGTYEEVSYTHLDATSQRDRLGRVTTGVFDSVRQLTRLTDPLGRVIRLDWCSCGTLRQLEDSLGRVITWEQDLSGRPTAKIYPDGSRESYVYEVTTSRLAQMIDARGQARAFQYHLDDAMAAILYPTSAPVPGTPAVWYDYDSAYPRLRSMIDGTGTTTYTYGPVGSGLASNANRLVEIFTTWTNSRIVFGYDEIGRLLSRSIDGVPQTLQRDAAGRPGTMQNALGSFLYTYDGGSERIARVDLPNGQVSHAAYRGNAADRQLQQIRNLAAGGANLSEFNYLSDAAGQLSSWQSQIGANPPLNQTFSHDAGSQLTAVSASGQNYAFSYDLAANRLTRTLNAATTTFSYNILNELQSASPALGADKSYTWDAESRLVRIDYGGSALQTRLTYDGAGRWVGLTEYNGATLLSDKRFVWCGSERCEERDAAGTVVRRFFGQGEQVGAVPYFYTFDHLGSIRELTDGAGNVRARYDYDPFGQRTKVAGDLEASAGYTGHYHHAPSGLNFTRFRAYDAATARWLSRDPLGEMAGLNRYAYAANGPLHHTDPLGLDTRHAGVSFGAGAGLVGSISAGFIADDKGNVGIYGGIDVGLGLAGGASADLQAGGTTATDIYTAAGRNDFTANASGAFGGKLGASTSQGTEKNGDTFVGFAGSVGVGIGGGLSLGTGPAGAIGFNAPEAARAAAAFLGFGPSDFAGPAAGSPVPRPVPPPAPGAVRPPAPKKPMPAKPAKAKRPAPAPKKPGKC